MTAQHFMAPTLLYLDLNLDLDPHLHLDLLKNPYSPCPVRLSAECGGSKERAFCVILVDFRQTARKALEYRVRPWVIVAGDIHLPGYGPQFFTDSNSVVSGCGFQKIQGWRIYQTSLIKRVR